MLQLTVDIFSKNKHISMQLFSIKLQFTSDHDCQTQGEQI